jgi:hypothetical protein
MNSFCFKRTVHLTSVLKLSSDIWKPFPSIIGLFSLAWGRLIRR